MGPFQFGEFFRKASKASAFDTLRFRFEAIFDHSFYVLSFVGLPTFARETNYLALISLFPPFWTLCFVKLISGFTLKVA